jgi:hypothetical protein
MIKRFRIVLLAVVALACVAAPTAAAAQPASDSLALDLEIFDLNTTTACGTWVFANVSGTIERHLYVKGDGSIDHQVETFRGRITWLTRDSDRTYSSVISTKIVIEFPNGVDLFNPVRITVTGTNGGVFPISDGPAGSGQLVYDGFMYAQDWDSGFVYWANEGAPLSMSGDFDNATQRICEALA